MQTLFSAGCVPGEESAHWVSTRQGRHTQGPVALCSRLQVPALPLRSSSPGSCQAPIGSHFTPHSWKLWAGPPRLQWLLWCPPLVTSPGGSAPLCSLCPVIFICQHCILAPHARFFLCYISFPNHYGCHPQGIKIEHKLHGGGKRGPSRVNTLQSRINSGSCGGVCAGWEA